MNQKLLIKFKENLSKGVDYYYGLLVKNDLIEEINTGDSQKLVKEHLESIFDKDGLFTESLFGKITAGIGRKTIWEEPWQTCLSFTKKTFTDKIFSMAMNYQIINNENKKLLYKSEEELLENNLIKERLIFKKENYNIEKFVIDKVVTLKVNIEDIQKEIQIIPEFKLVESLNEISNQLNLNKQ